MRAVDSSVAVRALLEQTEGHAAARAVVRELPSIPAHAMLETFSALTRMPEPVRLESDIAIELLRENFSDRVIAGIPPRSVLPWLTRLAASGIKGGAVYDALIAESARLAGATLVTADRRAAATYRSVGVDVQMLGD